MTGILLVLFTLHSSLGSAFLSTSFRENKGSTYVEEVYATLTENLDASYYTIQANKVYFKYEEKYDPGVNGSSLDYKVYNFKREALATSVILTKKMGTNYFILDLANLLSLDGNTTANFYLLEVTNAKGQKQYLRLRYLP